MTQGKCGIGDIATGAHDREIVVMKMAGESWGAIARKIGHGSAIPSVERQGTKLLMADDSTSGAVSLEALSLRIVAHLKGPVTGLKENASAGRALLQMYRAVGEYLVAVGWTIEVR